MIYLVQGVSTPCGRRIKLFDRSIIFLQEEIYKMNFTKTVFALAIGSVGIMGAMSAHAAVVNTGDLLTIQASTLDSSSFVVVGSGSYFAMDQNGNGTFSKSERVAMAPGTDGGLTIGVTTIGGASHSGIPLAGETGAIDAAWNFFGNTGTHFTVTPVTGDTTNGLDFTGWRVTWSGIPSINMGGGIQDCGTASDGICIDTPAKGGADLAGVYNNGTGIATFAWDGVYGSTYTLDYAATVPQADPSNFGGVKYALHLQGTVMAAPVPEASTYGMMLAGLGLVGFMARRRSRA